MNKNRNILNAQKIANRCVKGISHGKSTYHSGLYHGAIEMADYKDLQQSAEIRRTLLKFMMYLERRGFIDESLQYDTEHQVDTFLEQMAGK